MQNTKIQLFLLHFAGGNCYSFDFMKNLLRMDFEFLPLELPGRGNRFSENLLKTKDAAIQDYIKQIKKLRNHNPYIIYGHSMGATLGLSVTKGMEQLGNPPICLIVSGNAGPGVKDPDEDGAGCRYLLNDFEFKDVLRKLGGVPEEVLENKELFDFFNPILRADFEVLEKDTDLHEKKIVLKTPIYAMMGTEEKTSSRIDNWKKYTSANFRSEFMEGNHFFIYNQPQRLAKAISEILKV